MACGQMACMIRDKTKTPTGTTNLAYHQNPNTGLIRRLKIINMEKPRRAWSPALHFCGDFTPWAFRTAEGSGRVGSSLAIISVPRVLEGSRVNCPCGRVLERNCLQPHFIKIERSERKPFQITKVYKVVKGLPRLAFWAM